jgi:phage terminase large subunit-like protein
MHGQNKNLPVKLVNAARGKHVRAEPVAALYESGIVHHVGHFPDLEEQLGMTTTSGYQGNGSPDRMDALVWALTELMLSFHQTPPIVGPIVVTAARPGPGG